MFQICLGLGNFNKGSLIDKGYIERFAPHQKLPSEGTGMVHCLCR